ncbi:uncharacterized protein LOC125944260 [Dermacentor silvarum]|uniref:uncharacterized protein LOC125944260 n=1 Tax=Dermacentor silvarum TaxID=543639 RepID=UPI00210070F6|nr:uncharacterized protein LOC125944260 [Dermacentor silvarum]
MRIMKFVVVTLLLCLQDAAPGGQHLTTALHSSLSEQDRSRCKTSGQIKTQDCDGKYFQQNFVFKSSSQNCELYVTQQCGERIGNMFRSREECYRTCNPLSKCLLPKEKGFFGSNIGFYPVYTYDVEEDNCKKTRHNKKENIYPRSNAFESYEQCHNICMPNSKARPPREWRTTQSSTPKVAGNWDKGEKAEYVVEQHKHVVLHKELEECAEAHTTDSVWTGGGSVTAVVPILVRQDINCCQFVQRASSTTKELAALDIDLDLLLHLRK